MWSVPHILFDVTLRAKQRWLAKAALLWYRTPGSWARRNLEKPCAHQKLYGGDSCSKFALDKFNSTLSCEEVRVAINARLDNCGKAGRILAAAATNDNVELAPAGVTKLPPAA